METEIIRVDRGHLAPEDVAEGDPSFDQDLILYINSALMTIMQEWHGMNSAFRLVTGTETWDELLGGDTA